MTTKKAAPKTAPKGRAIVCTTEARGVFFGYVLDESKSPTELTIADARCAVKWANGRGWLGLAATGPQLGSRVSPAAPKLTLHKLTAVADASPEAVAQWEKGLWS